MPAPLPEIEEEEPAYTGLMPPLGVSSFLHLAVLVLLYACGRSYGAVREAYAPTAVFVPQAPRPPAFAPEPEPEKTEVHSTVRDLEDREGEEDRLANDHPMPVHEQKEGPPSDHVETLDEGATGHDALGDPNRPKDALNAMEISFVNGPGMRAPRGEGNSTGPAERYGPRNTTGGQQSCWKPYDPSGKTQDAVKAALKWLQHHQSPEGCWNAGGFEAHCHGEGHDKCTGPGAPEFSTGVTGLALLAYLGHGDTTQNGKYQDTVRRGLSWLKGQQSGDGCIGPKTTEKHLYNHAIATMALAEAVGMGEYNYKDAAQKAVNYLLACQNPAEKGGGWRYRNYNLPGTPSETDGNNDTSVTGWAVMALKSARVAELVIPDEAFDRADACLDAVYQTREEYRGVFGYLRKPNGNLGLIHEGYTTTAVGVLVRQLMARNKGVAEGAATLLERTPDWKAPNFYYWYYATLALFQTGGESWTAWNKPMKEALCKHQETKGCADGSWDPAQDTWGDAGGRVYTTAMGALCLEVYYRYQKGMKIHASH